MTSKLSRRKFLRKATKAGLGLGAVLGGSGLLGCGAVDKRSRRERPNVLLVLCDQMRADAMSCVGNPTIKTPNLDRLAKNGVLFNKTFAASPVCSPNRASILTGCWPHSHSVIKNNILMPSKKNTIAEVLKEKGYRTGYIGKWHLDGEGERRAVSVDRRQGFDYWLGFNDGGQVSYFESNYWDSRGNEIKANKYSADFETDAAIAFVENKQDEPFFLMLSFSQPHAPFEAPEKFMKMYKRMKIPVPENATNQDLIKENKAINLKLRPKGFRVIDRGIDERETEEAISKRARQYPKYYAMISNIDWNIGRLLDQLSKSGLDENTIVVFTSDHGDMMGSHGFRGKGIAYEESIRVPLIIKDHRYYSQYREVNQTEALVSSIDIMPTILDLCEVPIPRAVQGVSQAELLKGGQYVASDAIFSEHAYIGWRCIRTDEWKYVIGRADRPNNYPALFNLKNDPEELHSLYWDPAYESTREKLDQKLRKWMKETRDKCWDNESS